MSNIGIQGAVYCIKSFIYIVLLEPHLKKETVVTGTVKIRNFVSIPQGILTYLTAFVLKMIKEVNNRVSAFLFLVSCNDIVTSTNIYHINFFEFYI